MNKKKLEIDLATAKTLYKTASSEFKTLLEQNFTKQELSSDLKDIINSYEDACNYLKQPILVLWLFKQLYSDEKEAERAYYQHQIETIIKCFNAGWVVDFTDRSQTKYYPWFERRSSGWVVCHCSASAGNSGFGSGLYSKSSDIALHVANKFINIYSKILE